MRDRRCSDPCGRSTSFALNHAGLDRRSGCVLGWGTLDALRGAPVVQSGFRLDASRVGLVRRLIGAASLGGWDARGSIWSQGGRTMTLLTRSVLHDASSVNPTFTWVQQGETEGCLVQQSSFDLKCQLQDPRRLERVEDAEMWRLKGTLREPPMCTSRHTEQWRRGRFCPLWDVLCCRLRLQRVFRGGGAWTSQSRCTGGPLVSRLRIWFGGGGADPSTWEAAQTFSSMCVQPFCRTN